MKWNNLNALGKITLIIAIALIVTIVISIIGLIIGVGIITPLRIVFGLIYVLFLPGFILTFIFFPIRKQNNLDNIERIALSFALSIAVVPIIIFYLNLAGLKISSINSFISILGIILVELIIIAFQRRHIRNKEIF